MWKRLYVKYPLFLSDFNETWIFWTCFRKTQISNSIKIRPVEAELFHADGRTNKLIIISFRNFANTPGHSTFCPHNVFVCFVWIWEQAVVTICTTRFNTQEFHVLPTQCIYVFCVDLRTNNDCNVVQIWPGQTVTCSHKSSRSYLNHLVFHCTALTGWFL